VIVTLLCGKPANQENQPGIHLGERYLAQLAYKVQLNKAALMGKA